MSGRNDRRPHQTSPDAGPGLPPAVLTAPGGEAGLISAAGPSRLARSERTATAAAIISLLFGATLIVWGMSVGAATMTGGGVMSVGRGVMAAFLVLGIRLSRRHTANFPDGLYKVENIFAAIVGIIVMILAYELARVSIPHLDGTYLFSSDPKGALPFFLAAALLGLGLGFYKRRVGRAEGCPSLEADAYFSFADAGALVIIGLALALDIVGVPRVDGIAGLIVACFLAVIGIWILRGALRVLLDASVSREMLTRVRHFAEADPGIRKVLSVDARNSGSFVFLHLVVEPNAPDLAVAHDVARDLQGRLRADFPTVDSIGIEFSVPTGEFNAAVLLAADGASVVTGFQTAPLVAIVEVDSRGVAAEPQTAPNPAVALPAGAAVHLAVFLGRRSVDLLLVRDCVADDDARQTLQAYGIEILERPTIANLHDATRVLASVAAAPGAEHRSTR